MTEPVRSAADAARETARRETFRLARDAGAEIITRPIYSSRTEPTVRDVEPLAGLRAASLLHLAAQGLAHDYIRQAREAGHAWDQIGQALGLSPESDGPGATTADAAFTYAAGHPDTEAPWRPRTFSWTCRSCEQHISDHGLIQGPADDEYGHAASCSRLAWAIAEWDAETARWEAEWEAGQ